MALTSSNNLIVKKENDLFLPFNERDYLNILDNFIDYYYSKEILFFKIVLPYETDSNLVSEEHVLDKIESILIHIDFLEFVYARNIVENKSILLLIAVKSILGYDKSSSLLPYDILDDKIINTTKISYLSSKLKIKKVLKQVILNYDVNNLYYYQATSLQGYGHMEHVFFFLKTDFKPNLIKKLYYITTFKNELKFNDKFNDENCEFISDNTNFDFSNSDFIYSYNSSNVYSTRKKSHFSIINMWNLYMVLNNLYYDLENNKIYKRIKYFDTFRYEYFSELNYLSLNIYKIYSFLRMRFAHIFNYFPIEKLLRDHLSLANKELKNLAPYFFPISKKEEMEDIEAGNYLDFNKYIEKDIVPLFLKKVEEYDNLLFKFEDDESSDLKEEEKKKIIKKRLFQSYYFL